MGQLFILVVAALIGGFMAGLVGIGGGLIYVIIYNEYFQAAGTGYGWMSDALIVKAIIANSAFSTMFAGLAGSWKHYMIRNFYWRPVLLIGLPAIAASILTTFGLTYTQGYSKGWFTMLFACFLVPLILRVLFTRNSHEAAMQLPDKAPPLLLLLTGLASGGVTALSGLGGGVVVIPVLNSLLRIPIKQTISISLGVIALVGAGLSLYNMYFLDYELKSSMYSIGLIDFPLVVPVVVGVMVAAPLGVAVSQRMPDKWLKIVFVGLSLLIVVNLLFDLWT